MNIDAELQRIRNESDARAWRHVADIIDKLESGTATASDLAVGFSIMGYLGGSVEGPGGRMLTREDFRLLHTEQYVREGGGLNGTNLAGRLGARLRADGGARLAIVYVSQTEGQIGDTPVSFGPRFEVYACAPDSDEFTLVGKVGASVLADLSAVICRMGEAQP